jgi:putative ABC transport system permease protein
MKLTTMQEAIVEKENSVKQVSYALIGVTAFLILFSIINFISTIITNIAAKKQEFAILQSIGMKKKELEVMEIGEGTIIIGGSVLITFVLGSVLGKIMISFMKNAGVFYLTYAFPTGLFIVYIFILMLIAYILTICIFKILQKDSIVEQLRSIE